MPVLRNYKLFRPYISTPFEVSVCPKPLLKIVAKIHLMTCQHCPNSFECLFKHQNNYCVFQKQQLHTNGSIVIPENADTWRNRLRLYLQRRSQEHIIAVQGQPEPPLHFYIAPHLKQSLPGQVATVQTVCAELRQNLIHHRQ